MAARSDEVQVLHAPQDLRASENMFFLELAGYDTQDDRVEQRLDLGLIVAHPGYVCVLNDSGTGTIVVEVLLRPDPPEPDPSAEDAYQCGIIVPAEVRVDHTDGRPHVLHLRDWTPTLDVALPAAVPGRYGLLVEAWNRLTEEQDAALDEEDLDDLGSLDIQRHPPERMRLTLWPVADDQVVPPRAHRLTSRMASTWLGPPIGTGS